MFERLNDCGVDLTGNSSDSVYDIKKKQFQELFYWNITGTYGSNYPYATHYGIGILQMILELQDFVYQFQKINLSKMGNQGR